MTAWLKQSTAVTVPVGPFVDSTDGVTAETALTIAQADIRLSKNGGAFAQTNNATGASHMENGWYGVPLNTTDTGTLGELVVAVNESGACPVWRTFMVVPANVWDSMFGADKLQVHVDEMTASIITSTVLANDAITAAKVAADVTTEIQSGLATAAALATVDTNVDTLVTGVNVTTWLGVTPSVLSSGRVQALANALGASSVTAAALATDAVTEIADAVWASVARTLTADTNINYPSAATIATSVLTTQMTESYSTDGAAPTLAQAAFLTMQRLYDFAISGTTITVKKIDGSTTAATITLDDATTPTSSSRAT